MLRLAIEWKKVAKVIVNTTTNNEVPRTTFIGTLII